MVVIAASVSEVINLQQYSFLYPDGEVPRVPIFVRKTTFRLPFKPSTSAIMVGPGTGLAPFRGFIQDRHSVMKEGKLHCPCHISDSSIQTEDKNQKDQQV